MARWCRCGPSVADPFGCRCLTRHSVLRFHVPLIKPDVRISRIRLSDKDSRVRPRKAACPHREPDQAQLAVRVLAPTRQMRACTVPLGGAAGPLRRAGCSGLPPPGCGAGTVPCRRRFGFANTSGSGRAGVAIASASGCLVAPLLSPQQRDQQAQPRSSCLSPLPSVLTCHRPGSNSAGVLVSHLRWQRGP